MKSVCTTKLQQYAEGRGEEYERRAGEISSGKLLAQYLHSVPMASVVRYLVVGGLFRAGKCARRGHDTAEDKRRKRQTDSAIWFVTAFGFSSCRLLAFLCRLEL